MLALKTANILDTIIPISRFNKGEANKIFSEVKSKGIMDEYEDAVLLAEAIKRDKEKVKPISQKKLLEKYGISEEELDDIEVEIE